MIILTVGKSYVDIDGYASCLAYRELLKMQGIDAKFVTAASLNYSISKSLLDLPYHIDNYEIKNEDRFIILDLSNKDFFPDFVNEKQIIEIIDHHPGFENCWKDKLNDKAIIEQIGSVATIIVEKYEQYDSIDKMDKNIAKLLMAAILDNTLNFTANITSERDKRAYQILQKIVDDINFVDIYFNECQTTIENNLEESILKDLKIQKVNEYIPDVFGQITIWDINRIMNKLDTVKEIMNNYDDKWIINIISLKDNTSYILSSDDEVKKNLIKLFNCSYKDNLIIIKPALLRKEIMRHALSKNKSL